MTLYKVAVEALSNDRQRVYISTEVFASRSVIEAIVTVINRYGIDLNDVTGVDVDRREDITDEEGDPC